MYHLPLRHDTQPFLPLLLFTLSHPPSITRNYFHKNLTIFHPDVPLETGVRHLHTPQRVLRSVGGGGLVLIPNSTTRPVRSSQSSVVMGFDVQTVGGERWSARVISNGKEECNLFLMDSTTLQRKAMAKLKVGRCNSTQGHTVTTSLTVFDLSAFAILHSAVLWWWWWHGVQCLRLSKAADFGLHMLYRRMVVCGEQECKGAGGSKGEHFS